MYTRDEFGGYMYPDNAFQPTGGRNNPFARSMKLWGGGKGSSAPDPNPGMMASAEAAKVNAATQEKIAKESLDFAKLQYADMKPQLDAIFKQQVDIANANEARAAEYSKFETETFRPMQKQLVQEAKDYNTAAKQEQFASRAAADINQGYSSAKDQALRNLSRYGINPNSGRFAALNASLGMQQAGDLAGGQTNARLQAEGLGYARMQDAVNIGNNLPANATAAYGMSLGAGNAASANKNTAAQYMSNQYNQAGSMYNAAGQTYGTAGNIYGQEYSTRMQGYSAGLQSQASSNAGMGSLLAMGAKAGIGAMSGGWAGAALALGGTAARADGGQVKGLVRGPGGPVDDQIPTLLSDGEYVIPADTVKKIGVKKLDKMVKQTHTPAKEQRQGIRRK